MMPQTIRPLPFSSLPALSLCLLAMAAPALSAGIGEFPKASTAPISGNTDGEVDTDTGWTQEIRIPLANLDIDSPLGHVLGVEICSNDGKAAPEIGTLFGIDGKRFDLGSPGTPSDPGKAGIRRKALFPVHE